MANFEPEVLIGQTEFTDLLFDSFDQPQFSFLVQIQVAFWVSYGMPFTTIFQMVTASFLAVALIADTLPFRKLILWKKSLRGVESLRLPIALAAFLKCYFEPVASFWNLAGKYFAAADFIVGSQPQP